MTEDKVKQIWAALLENPKLHILVVVARREDKRRMSNQLMLYRPEDVEVTSSTENCIRLASSGRQPSIIIIAPNGNINGCRFSRAFLDDEVRFITCLTVEQLFKRFQELMLYTGGAIV